MREYNYYWTLRLSVQFFSAHPLHKKKKDGEFKQLYKCVKGFEGRVDEVDVTAVKRGEEEEKRNRERFRGKGETVRYINKQTNKQTEKKTSNNESFTKREETDE